jgi:hypothetical protein
VPLEEVYQWAGILPPTAPPEQDDKPALRIVPTEPEPEPDDAA